MCTGTTGGYNAAGERCCGALGMSIRTGEKRKSLFSFFSLILFIFRLRSHVICLFHPFLFWPPACLFSLRQTDLVIWTVIVVV